MKLMTVKPKFMETHFGKTPQDVFNISKKDPDIHKSGLWLQDFYAEDLEEGTLAFSNSNLTEDFLQKFEEHILFNLYIDREEYAFEYWNTPLTK